MRIQNIAAINQVNALQRAFNIKQVRTLQLPQASVPTKPAAKPALPIKPVAPQRGSHTRPVTGKPNPTDNSSSPTNAKPLAVKSPAMTTASTDKSVDLATSSSDTPSTPNDHADLTMQGLLDAWGQSQTPYDLNGDGTVNTDDLLQFIHDIPAASDQGSMLKPLKIDPADPTLTAPPDLVAATSVTIQPALTTAAATITPAASIPNSAPPSNDLATSITPAVESGTTQQLSLNGLLDAWGQAKTPYDLNGDGTVNTDDLLQFINGNLSPGKSNQPAAAADPNASTSSNAGGNARLQSLGGLAKLTDTLIDRLSQAGFADQPPINIRQLVGSLNLSSKQTDHVFSRLEARYPKGLGVNVLG